MPVAIIHIENKNPIVIETTSDEELIFELSNLAIVPNANATNKTTVTTWLESLNIRSGWFVDTKSAQAHQDAVARLQSMQLVAALPDHAKHFEGLSARQIAAAIGYKDKDGSTARKLKTGITKLTGQSQRSLAYAIKFGLMSIEEEQKILSSVNNGAWRLVDRAQIDLVVKIHPVQDHSLI